MKKEHVRTYRIAEHGDVLVTHWNKGEEVDLSGHYEAPSANLRRELVAETALDVFRYADTHLAWSLSPNGQTVQAARSLAVLLEMFLGDVDKETGTPTSF